MILPLILVLSGFLVNEVGELRGNPLYLGFLKGREKYIPRLFGMPVKRHFKTLSEEMYPRKVLFIPMDGEATTDWYVGYDKHYRVHHGEDEFARGTSHINGIESFWSYAKRRLTQFNGVPKHTFILHLKETEFRFNHRNDNLYQLMLQRLRKDPL